MDNLNSLSERESQRLTRIKENAISSISDSWDFVESMKHEIGDDSQELKLYNVMKKLDEAKSIVEGIHINDESDFDKRLPELESSLKGWYSLLGTGAIRDFYNERRRKSILIMMARIKSAIESVEYFRSHCVKEHD